MFQVALARHGRFRKKPVVSVGGRPDKTQLEGLICLTGGCETNGSRTTGGLAGAVRAGRAAKIQIDNGAVLETVVGRLPAIRHEVGGGFPRVCTSRKVRDLNGRRATTGTVGVQNDGDVRLNGDRIRKDHPNAIRGVHLFSLIRHGGQARCRHVCHLGYYRALRVGYTGLLVARPQTIVEECVEVVCE